MGAAVSGCRMAQVMKPVAAIRMASVSRASPSTTPGEIHWSVDVAGCSGHRGAADSVGSWLSASRTSDFARYGRDSGCLRIFLDVLPQPVCHRGTDRLSGPLSSAADVARAVPLRRDIYRTGAARWDEALAATARAACVPSP